MKKNFLRRLLYAVLLTVGLFPAITVTASASFKSISGLNVENLNGTYEVATTSFKREGSCSANGTAGFTASAIGHQGLFSSYTATTTVRLTNNNTSLAATLSFKLSSLRGTVTIDGKNAAELGGSFSKKVVAGDSIDIVLTSKDEDNPASITVSDLKMELPNIVTITFLPAEHGSYTVDGGNVVDENQIEKESTESYTVTTTADAGYKFLCWYDVDTGENVSLVSSGDLIFTTSHKIKPIFVEESSCIFEVSRTKRFTDLKEADEFATEIGNGIIVLVSDGVLPSGNYTISSGNTLLIPYDDMQTLPTNSPVPENYGGASTKAFRTLTMAQGASISVDGAISVASKQASTSSSATANPSGPYGYIKMEEGSSITINGGGNLYAWGYISGGGSVVAKSEATVYECFQIADWRGGNATSDMIGNSKKVFPFSQYYIQNIEAALTLESGAQEITYATITATIPITNQPVTSGATVKFIGASGSDSLFEIGTGGKLTKTYDPATDRMIFDVQGDMSLKSIKLSIYTYDIDSSQYILPINSNMTVNIESGTTTATASVELPAGVEMNINEGAELIVDSGAAIYVYDRDQWFQVIGNDNEGVGAGSGYAGTYNYGYIPVAFSPSKTYTRLYKDFPDAVIDVNGTLTVKGNLYTTSSGADSGADIKSSQGTGKVTFQTTAPSDVSICQATQSGSSITYVTTIPATSAMLHNGDKSYTLTTNSAAGDIYTYCTACGKWVKGENGLVHIIENGDITGHAKTLEDAKTEYGDPAAGKYIQMLDNSDGETVTFVNGTVIDLNGCTVTNVSVGGTLYGMDSKTDGYVLGTGDDAPGSITVSGTVAPVTEFKNKNTTEKTEEGKSYIVSLHRYLAVQSTDNTWSFHRFNISVGEKYYMEIISDKTAKIGVSGYFRGDSAVRGKLSEMGFKFDEADAVMADAGNISDPCTFYYTSDAKRFTKAELTPVVMAVLKFKIDEENYCYSYSIDREIDFITLLNSYYKSCDDAAAKAILQSYATAVGITLS